MVYIKILETFQDIHDKHIFRKDKFVTIAEERYAEILENAKRLNKELIRLATEEEIKENFKNAEVDETEEVTEDSEKQEELKANKKTSSRRK